MSSRVSTRFVRIFLLGTVATLALDLVIVGCSSDKPPPGGVSSSGSIGDATPHEAAADASDASDGGDASDGNFDAGFFECLDDKPMLMPDGGTPANACPGSPTCSAYCDQIHTHYKLGVAQTAIACVLALPSCTTKTDVLVCVDNAVAAVCADPTAATYCGGFVKACDPTEASFSESNCEALANALSASGRSTFSSCVNDKIDAGTCPADHADCVVKIRP